MFIFRIAILAVVLLCLDSICPYLCSGEEQKQCVDKGNSEKADDPIVSDLSAQLSRFWLQEPQSVLSVTKKRPIVVMYFIDVNGLVHDEKIINSTKILMIDNEALKALKQIKLSKTLIGYHETWFIFSSVFIGDQTYTDMSPVETNLDLLPTFDLKGEMPPELKKWLDSKPSTK